MRPIFQRFLHNRFPINNPVLSTPITAVDKPGAKTLLFSLLAAIAAVIIAQFTIWGINVISNLVFLGEWSVNSVDPSNSGLGIGIIAMPIAGALLVALITWLNKTWLQPLAALINMGTGMSFGPEGVIFSSSETIGKNHKLIFTAGIVAGIAYLFGSPFAAVLLAIEVLGVASAPINILVLILSAGIGAGAHYGYIGSDPVFQMRDLVPATGQALTGYAVTGIITGLIAILWTRTAKGISKLWKGNQTWLPIIAAVIIGICGYFAPEMLGPGWDNITALLNGTVTLRLLFVLGLVKFIAWAFAAGSGARGGNILPLMIMGGAFGLFTTLLLQVMFPAVHLNPGVAALVGMMAMLSAGLRIWVAAIILGLEMTRQGHALLPLVCAVTIAYGMAFLLSKKNMNASVHAEQSPA